MTVLPAGRVLGTPDSRRRPPGDHLTLVGGRSSAFRAHRAPDPKPMSDQLTRKLTLSEDVSHAGSAREERLQALWRLTVSERVQAMRDGCLTLEQLAAWSARHPDQVPQLNGEFEWIAAHTPEACE